MGGKQSSFSPYNSCLAQIANGSLQDCAADQALVPKAKDAVSISPVVKERFIKISDDAPTPSNLIAAIENDNVVFLHQLLSADADVNFHITNDKRTPLHFAASRGLTNITALLLDRQADVFAQTSQGYRAIYFAAIERHVKVFRVLLMSELGCKRPCGQVPTGWTAGSICKAMVGYPERVRSCYIPLAHVVGDQQLIDLWQVHLESAGLDQPIKPVSKSQTETFLHLLINTGRCHAIETLLHLGVEVEGFDKSGFQPIHLAARLADLDILSALIEKGADVNAKSADGETAILTALDTDPDGSVVKLLLQKGADINTVDKQGFSVLDRAAKGNYSCIVADLLKLGPDVGKCWYEGLLFYTASQGNLDFVRGLLKKGFSPNSVRAGKMPHHMASEQGHAEALHELLVNNCLINEMAFGGRTALELSVKNRSFNTAKLLIQHGASLDVSPSRTPKPFWLSGTASDLKMAILKSANPGIEDMTKASLMAVVDTDVKPMIDSYLGEPMLLGELCRRTIRRHIISAHPNHSIWTNVQKLNLPKVLRSYILLE